MSVKANYALNRRAKLPVICRYCDKTFVTLVLSGAYGKNPGASQLQHSHRKCTADSQS